MKSLSIRGLVVLGVLAIAGIMFTQINWVSKAMQSHEQQFNHSVQMALRGVVESLCELNGNDMPSINPIDQISKNYFIARTRDKIDPISLDYLIAGEFQKRNIVQDFEYGIYDCETDQMVYGQFVSMSGESKSGESKTGSNGKLPDLTKDEYYFGVYFLKKKAGIVTELGFWQFTTLLTVLIVIFFGYSLLIILRQKRMSEIQRDFFNNITHEFKTPLSTLKVSSQVLSDNIQDTKLKKYSRIILEEASRLEQQVHQLLKASFVDHYQSNKLEKLDPTQVLKTVITHFKENQFVELQMDIEERTVLVAGDRMLLENIYFNLLDNARKYGQGLVTINTLVEGKFWKLSICNPGGQLQKRDLKKIFNRFYRVPTGDQHDVKGFGLGLYFVKQAVSRMRGKVSVESTKSSTRFEVKLRIV